MEFKGQAPMRAYTAIRRAPRRSANGEQPVQITDLIKPGRLSFFPHFFSEPGWKPRFKPRRNRRVAAT
jgi:hypothetical protein